ncbi:MAG: hypothetical protein COA50_11100 [Flavobacteriaceae bacterium]|nr:MAG: hypothetical protein COA50_11100 [Flavobacteriaceae bacterium]
MKYRLNKLKILHYLFKAVILLLIGHVFAIFLRLKTSGLEEKIPRLIIKLFDFNLETNLPTYFSSLVLLINGFLLMIIGSAHKKTNKKFYYWYGLAVVFCFLSLDEMVQIHEQLNAPMGAILKTKGILYFSWFIPYIIIMIIMGIAYFKFMMRLPKDVLKLFILAGVLFVSGAVGMEALSGMHAEIHGFDNITYYIMYTIEELLEMSGAIVFLYALLHYITKEFKNFEVMFKPKTKKTLKEA